MPEWVKKIECVGRSRTIKILFLTLGVLFFVMKMKTSLPKMNLWDSIALVSYFIENIVSIILQCSNLFFISDQKSYSIIQYTTFSLRNIK